MGGQVAVSSRSERSDVGPSALRLKILACIESPVVGELLRLSLEPAGHALSLSGDPFALADEAPGAAALLVAGPRARQAVAVLRDRGFAGPVLVLEPFAGAEQERLALEAGADRVLALEPIGELPRRLAEAAGGKRRILVVDDSEIAARLLSDELRQAGFEVLVAHDVEAATSFVVKRATRPHLVLLDIHMPKVNGAQFCRFIKKNEMFRSVKVVFCSGDRREEVARLAEECGADGFVLKGEFLGKWIVENT